MLEELRERVLRANLELVSEGLVKLTWGNASGIDREQGLMVIKPSGVDYGKMGIDDMVVVDLSGRVVEGRWKPSSDTSTHLMLYEQFDEIGGIVHTHSPWATAWAQAVRPIPCLGTTHADHFFGEVPCTRLLTAKEIMDDYEAATGRVIAETFRDLNPLEVPGVLVAEHGPFTWGREVSSAVSHAIILEEIAKMAYHTVMLGNDQPVQRAILEKHYRRKHGDDAYYGQR